MVPKLEKLRFADVRTSAGFGLEKAGLNSPVFLCVCLFTCHSIKKRRIRRIEVIFGVKKNNIERNN